MTTYTQGYRDGLEAAAKACDDRYMGDNSREDMEARRCAADIRNLPVPEQQPVSVADVAGAESQKMGLYDADGIAALKKGG